MFENFQSPHGTVDVDYSADGDEQWKVFCTAGGYESPSMPLFQADIVEHVRTFWAKFLLEKLLRANEVPGWLDWHQSELPRAVQNLRGRVLELGGRADGFEIAFTDTVEQLLKAKEEHACDLAHVTLQRDDAVRQLGICQDCLGEAQLAKASPGDSGALGASDRAAPESRVAEGRCEELSREVETTSALLTTMVENSQKRDVCDELTDAIQATLQARCGALERRYSEVLQQCDDLRVLLAREQSAGGHVVLLESVNELLQQQQSNDAAARGTVTRLLCDNVCVKSAREQSAGGGQVVQPVIEVLQQQQSVCAKTRVELARRVSKAHGDLAEKDSEIAALKQRAINAEARRDQAEADAGDVSLAHTHTCVDLKASKTLADRATADADSLRDERDALRAELADVKRERDMLRSARDRLQGERDAPGMSTPEKTAAVKDVTMRVMLGESVMADELAAYSMRKRKDKRKRED